MFDAIEALGELAATVGVDLARLAQSWVVSQECVTSMIVGPRTVEHLEESLATDVLSADVLEAIDRIAPPGRCLYPQYGSDGLAWHPWGPHTQRWP